MSDFWIGPIILAVYSLGYWNAKCIYKQRIADVSNELSETLSKTMEVWVFLDSLAVDKRKLIENEYIKLKRQDLEKLANINPSL